MTTHNTAWTTTLTLGVLTSLILAFSASAQNQPLTDANKRFYIRGDIGGTWMKETELESFPGMSGTREVEFNPGARLDLGFGYNFLDWLAAELEIGMIGNEIDEIAGAQEVDAALANVPFMLSGIVEYPYLGRFKPFLGAGVGFSSTILDVDEITIDNNTVFGGSESDIVFACQGTGGIKYDITDHWSLTLAYRYLFTDEPEWKVRRLYFGGSSQRIRLDDLRTHSVTVGFAYRF